MVPSPRHCPHSQNAQCYFVTDSRALEFVGKECLWALILAKNPTFLAIDGHKAVIALVVHLPVLPNNLSMKSVFVRMAKQDILNRQSYPLTTSKIRREIHMTNIVLHCRNVFSSMPPFVPSIEAISSSEPFLFRKRRAQRRCSGLA